MAILNEISENLQSGKIDVVKELVQSALDEGIPAEEILHKGLLEGMNAIGEKFKNLQVFIPQVLVSARAMNEGTLILKSALTANKCKGSGRIVLGTVQGDMHDIGKNLVKMMMECKGLEVYDLGTDVSPAAFIRTAQEKDCQVIALSALLTTTMEVMADVVNACTDAGIRDKVKIMIGGAPVTEDFCKQIGADIYTADATQAAEAALAVCS